MEIEPTGAALRALGSEPATAGYLTIALKTFCEHGRTYCSRLPDLTSPHQKAPLPPGGLSLCMRETMPEINWQRRFEDPVLLPDGTLLHTLGDSADYITGLPKQQCDMAQWKVAIETLILAARSGPTLLAQIAFINALNRNLVLVFNPDAKKHLWGGNRQFKRNEWSMSISSSSRRSTGERVQIRGSGVNLNFKTDKTKRKVQLPADHSLQGLN
jgi:hypothetical protein